MMSAKIHSEIEVDRSATRGTEAPPGVAQSLVCGFKSRDHRVTSVTLARLEIRASLPKPACSFHEIAS